MKKIKRLTLSEIKVGNEYGLVYRFSCEPMGRVKILEVGNDTISVQSSSSPGSFEVNLLWYSMFRTYKDSFIAYSYVECDYIIIQSQPGWILAPDLVWFGFHVLHLAYTQLIELDGQKP